MQTTRETQWKNARKITRKAQGKMQGKQKGKCNGKCKEYILVREITRETQWKIQGSTRETTRNHNGKYDGKCEENTWEHAREPPREAHCQTPGRHARATRGARHRECSASRLGSMRCFREGRDSTGKGSAQETQMFLRAERGAKTASGAEVGAAWEGGRPVLLAEGPRPHARTAVHIGVNYGPPESHTTGVCRAEPRKALVL